MHASHAATAPASHGWDAFSSALASNFDRTDVLFTTNVTGLFTTFLESLPAHLRQSHTCHCCRRFVDTFGGLVSIDERGGTHSALWSFEAPEPYTRAVANLRRKVDAASVNGVHISGARVWGTPSVGGYTHMAVRPEASRVFHSPTQSPHQRASERREEYRMLRHALEQFSLQTLRQAHRLLADGTLYRSEKCVDMAAWLVDLADRRTRSRSSRRDNLIWRAVGSAPAGWAHVRSGMLGTLLEDIDNGLAITDIQQRFADKMNPLQYLRPTAAPTAGNVAAAEKLVATLKTAGALKRRFATLEDIRPLWTPSAPRQAPSKGIFAGLVTRTRSNPRRRRAAPEIAITWVKFASVVLPDARNIDVHFEQDTHSFYSFVTASNPDAPPILQWDHEGDRNPVSWYTYTNGSDCSRWGIHASKVRCEAVSLFPFQWTSKLLHQGAGALFVLEGCHDSAHRSGAGWFPEQLRSEYHPIRSTMEAHARRSTIARSAGQHAAGIAIRASGGAFREVCLEVERTDGTWSRYRIDRWD